MSEYFYIDREFDDFDAFAASTRSWNVQMTQLSQGKSINTLQQLSVEHAKLNYMVFNGHKTTVGDPPSGRTFAFHSSSMNSELIWRKKKVGPNDLMIFPSGAEHDVMTKGQDIHVFVVTLPESVWRASLSDRDAEIWHKQLSSREIVSLSDRGMSKLKYSLLSYFKIIKKTPDVLDLEPFRRSVGEQTILAITRALSVAKINHSLESTRKSTPEAWGKIEKIIRVNGRSLLPISQLSQAAGVSERSLRRLFHDRYGISPKNYLNRIRLNGVRRDLRKRSSGETAITDIANNWGFWHMGQFAADYKLLFGELPSTTLNKIRSTLDREQNSQS